MKLVYPNKKYYKSYQDAYNEFKSNNVTTYRLTDCNENDLEKKYRNYRHGLNLPNGWVPATTYWLVENNEFMGEIGIRHRLNENLINYGGHIGYCVRYSYWNKGIGTKMLSMALKKAKQLGLTKVLITCNNDNFGSARVIEKMVEYLKIS